MTVANDHPVPPTSPPRNPRRAKYDEASNNIIAKPFHTCFAMMSRHHRHQQVPTYNTYTASTVTITIITSIPLMPNMIANNTTKANHPKRSSLLANWQGYKWKKASIHCLKTLLPVGFLNFHNVPKFEIMFHNVPRCSIMFHNVPQFYKMLRNVS